MTWQICDAIWWWVFKNPGSLSHFPGLSKADTHHPGTRKRRNHFSQSHAAPGQKHSTDPGVPERSRAFSAHLFTVWLCLRSDYIISNPVDELSVIALLKAIRPFVFQMISPLKGGHWLIYFCYWVQFSSVAQLCPTLCDRMDCSTPGLPVHHQLPELTQTHAIWVCDAIQPSHPLSSPSRPAFNLSQHQGLFQWVSSSHQVAKVLEFQLQHQPFQWIFRTDLL